VIVACGTGAPAVQEPDEAVEGSDRGTPRAPADLDGDTIADALDLCPTEPETMNGNEDSDGCPDSGGVALGPSEIVIMDKITFDSGTATIKPASHDLLDAVAKTLDENPGILHVEVAAHSDEQGLGSYNLKLSAERAAAVVSYLVAAGVAPERLSAAGYGEECPLDPGHDQAAWEKNRRVQFWILETTEGCTGVAFACDGAVAAGLVPAGDLKYLPGSGHCTGP
jgi:outer membrane protein OmpA-like peptidoglycan-associated protein